MLNSSQQNCNQYLIYMNNNSSITNNPQIPSSPQIARLNQLKNIKQIDIRSAFLPNLSKVRQQIRKFNLKELEPLSKEIQREIKIRQFLSKDRSTIATLKADELKKLINQIELLKDNRLQKLLNVLQSRYSSKKQSEKIFNQISYKIQSWIIKIYLKQDSEDQNQKDYIKKALDYDQEFQPLNTNINEYYEEENNHKEKRH